MSEAAIEKFADIENEAEFLKAHAQAKQDLTEIKAELKRIEKERDELKAEVESVSTEALDDLKSQLLKAKVQARLTADGLPDVDGVSKYLDYDGVELDEEGNLVGLDEKVEALKADLPTLFDAKRRAGRAGADVHDKEPAKAAKGSTEAQVDALFARR